MIKATFLLLEEMLLYLHFLWLILSINHELGQPHCHIKTLISKKTFTDSFCSLAFTLAPSVLCIFKAFPFDLECFCLDFKFEVWVFPFAFPFDQLEFWINVSQIPICDIHYLVSLVLFSIKHFLLWLAYLTISIHFEVLHTHPKQSQDPFQAAKPFRLCFSNHSSAFLWSCHLRIFVISLHPQSEF